MRPIGLVKNGNIVVEEFSEWAHMDETAKIAMGVIANVASPH